VMIAATSSFAVGRFTVHQRPRLDNPYFAVFIVHLKGVYIGRQFSMPSVGDCESLGRRHMPKTQPQERTQKYGRRAAIALSTCERCGSTFSGLSALCVPCRESKNERRHG
jgi:hypothetical protein